MSTLKTLWTVAAKELAEIFRDRKIIINGLLLSPLLFPILILGMGALAENRAKTQLESELKLPVIGADIAPNLVAFLATQNITAEAAPENPDALILAQEKDVILRIAPDFADDWRASRAATVEILHDSSRQDSQIPVRRVERALQAYGRQAGAIRLIARGVDPSLGTAVSVTYRDLATPEAKRGMILAFLPYLLILSAFLGGAYLVMDATAGERERQSLEPLLATPAGRGAIMSGKIAAACAFGMIGLLLTLLSFKLSFAFVDSGPFKGVDVSMVAVAKLLLVLLPMVLIGTTLLTLISASVKTLKEAQSYMAFLMLLPILPTIILMVNPVKNALWMFATPFLSQNQLILMVLRAETITGLQWATYIGAGFGLGALLWLIAARLYHREQLAISA
ncbi:ABC transporter permease [Silanimonas sp.]|uniref:ABC transporter permease n=1 Tax=Silanimonas sp. TaxID=1929290 RepID=UPI0022C49E85|nr:ABC transporter permease [Silanimonas sp.]MCZ8114586.1 ABC transporter permease [Silanimonas sp.]